MNSFFNYRTAFFVGCLASMALTGCVTPQQVKEASTKHAANLNQLEQSAKAYRSQADADFGRRIGLQREAYIAQRIGASIEKDAATLADSAANAAQPALPDKPSLDFITFATQLREDYGFFKDNFDLWLSLKGADMEARKAEMKSMTNQVTLQLAALSKDNPNGTNDAKIARRERTLKGLQANLRLSDDELAHVAIAIQIAGQRINRLAKLDLLIEQIKVMKAFHGVVDDYLSIDATINGAVIAQAAAAGSKLDLSGLPELQKLPKP